MSDIKKPYQDSIDKGKVRIVVKVEDIDVEISNSAEEFISSDDDTTFLYLEFVELDIESINNKGYELNLSSSKNAGDSVLNKESIWFDVDMEKVATLLNDSVQFSIKGNYPKHISYFIKKLQYKIEWLQYDEKSNKIATVSVTKKTYSQPRLERVEDYSIEDISKAATLLDKAIKKIDLRTRTAYVRLNTNDGKLDPLITIIAAKLGYQVETLSEDTISELRKQGQKATHIISLIINY